MRGFSCNGRNIAAVQIKAGVPRRERSRWMNGHHRAIARSVERHNATIGVGPRRRSDQPRVTTEERNRHIVIDGIIRIVQKVHTKAYLVNDEPGEVPEAPTLYIRHNNNELISFQFLSLFTQFLNTPHQQIYAYMPLRIVSCDSSSIELS